MSDVETKSRDSMTAADRLAARERTNVVAHEALAEERRQRGAKTERLEHARLQASNTYGETIMDDAIRKAAYKRWEDEGRPEGQHERHWREAEEASSNPSGTPQTWSSDHGGGVVPPDGSESSSDAVPSNEPGSFKPGELASKNK